MCQVLFERERDSLLCSDMLAAMKDAGKLDRAAWLQKCSWVGFEQPVDQVFPDGKYGPMTPVGGIHPLPTFGVFRSFPISSGIFPPKTHISPSLWMWWMDTLCLMFIKGKSPKRLSSVRKQVAHALAARNEELQNEAFM